MQQLRRPLTTAIGVAITREVLRGNYPTCVRPGGQVLLPSEALQCMDEFVIPAEATKGRAADHGVKRSGIQLHQLT